MIYHIGSFEQLYKSKEIIKNKIDLGIHKIAYMERSHRE